MNEEVLDQSMQSSETHLQPMPDSVPIGNYDNFNNANLSNANPNSRQNIVLLIIGVIILLIGVIGAFYYFYSLYNSSNDLPTNNNLSFPIDNSNSPTPVASPSQLPVQPVQTPATPPLIEPGWQQYINNQLGYGFNYLESDLLNQCSGIPCLSIDRMTLRIETLDDYVFSSGDAKLAILGDDLFCSADGGGISVSCQNTQVDDYTNPLGFTGYRVMRTKTITGKMFNGFEPGSYSDLVYVYFLPKFKTNPEDSKYAAIMFAVDHPSQKNLEELQAIAETFFTF